MHVILFVLILLLVHGFQIGKKEDDDDYAGTENNL